MGSLLKSPPHTHWEPSFGKGKTLSRDCPEGSRGRGSFIFSLGIAGVQPTPSHSFPSPSHKCTLGLSFTPSHTHTLIHTLAWNNWGLCIREWLSWNIFPFGQEKPESLPMVPETQPRGSWVFPGQKGAQGRRREPLGWKKTEKGFSHNPVPTKLEGTGALLSQHCLGSGPAA